MRFMRLVYHEQVKCWSLQFGTWRDNEREMFMEGMRRNKHIKSVYDHASYLSAMFNRETPEDTILQIAETVAYSFDMDLQL